MDQVTGDQIAAQLGLTPDRVQALRRLPYEKALVDLDELKKEARSRYRKLVFKWHPDRNPNDPKATEKLTDLAQVLRTIEGLKLQRQAPPPAMHVHFQYVRAPVVHVRAPSYSTSTSTSTSTSASTVTYNAGRVVFVRPV